jgi:hypothetical protein
MNAAPRPIRPARKQEVYITLCICGHESENHAAEVDTVGTVTCSGCSLTALVEWREARTT